jgi:hypothetical protein
MKLREREIPKCDCQFKLLQHLMAWHMKGCQGDEIGIYLPCMLLVRLSFLHHAS